MSKGSKRRPTSKTFKENFDQIKWTAKPKYANRKRQRPAKAHHVIPDIEPYQAIGGEEAGSWITSRSHHREYLRKNNFEEVGNEWDYFSKHHGKTHDNPTRNWRD